MAQHLDKGTFGEQGAGFFFGARGYFFVDGPSGTGGHAANARGFDGVAYNAKTDHLIIYDNKNYASSSNVSTASAITANLGSNLKDMINHVKNMGDLPAKDRILELLTKTQASVTKTGVKAPNNVEIAVTHFGGNSKDITKTLRDRGITSIEMNNAPAVPAGDSKTYINKKTIPLMAQATRQPVPTGAAAYNMRAAKVGGVGELVRYVAQTLNDYSLKYAIDRKLEDLAPNIASILAYGNGALVVIHINATSPYGNAGMVVARSISSAFVVAHPGANGREAIMAWMSSPKLFQDRPPHVRLETQFIWIPPVTVH